MIIEYGQPNGQGQEVSTATPLPVTLEGGSSIAAKVDIDQTTPGTTNGVVVNAALPAGTNVIGHVIVDSEPTTPAGTNIIGKVGIDQTTPGATNGVTLNSSSGGLVATIRNPTADALVVASTPVLVVESPLYNGTTIDRPRSIQGDAGAGLGVTAVEMAGASFANMTTGTTTTIKNGSGILHKIIVNTQVASATIKLYNGTTAVNIFATITLPSTITGDQPFTLHYDLWFSTGLTIVTSGATDITIVYR